MVYFIYKALDIARLGGVLPDPKRLPDDVKLGLAKRDYFYLGCCENPEHLLPIKEYIVTFVDRDTAEGFTLLGMSRVPKNPTDPTSELRDLTPEELEKQEKARKLLLKLRLRQRIYGSVEDLEDIVAFLSKRIDLLERLFLTTLYYILKNERLPDSLEKSYLSIAETYIKQVEEGRVKTRVDVEDPKKLHDKVMKKVTEITKLVEAELLSKK